LPYSLCNDQLQDPTGLPGLRRYPFVRDTALDPGKVASSRIIEDTHAAFGSWDNLGLHILVDFMAQSRTPHDRCLRFAPHVAMTHARLAPDLLAKL